MNVASVIATLDAGLALVEKAAPLAAAFGPAGAAAGALVGQVATFATAALDEVTAAEGVASETDLATIQGQVASIRAANDALAAQIAAD